MTTPLARNLRRHRESRGWSQRHLADLTGVTNPAISQWENSHRYPRPRFQARLEAVLGVNLDQN